MPASKGEIQLSLWFASTGHWAATKHVTLCHQHGFTADYFSRFEDGLWLLHLQDRIFHFKSLHELISYQGACTLGCNPMMDKAAFSGIITEPSAVTRPLTMWSATDFSSSASQGWIGMGYSQKTYLSKTLLFINSYHSEHSEVNRCPWCVLIFWQNARTFFIFFSDVFLSGPSSVSCCVQCSHRGLLGLFRQLSLLRHFGLLSQLSLPGQLSLHQKLCGEFPWKNGPNVPIQLQKCCSASVGGACDEKILRGTNTMCKVVQLQLQILAANLQLKQDSFC